MPLNLADIQRWSPESIDEIARAAYDRALSSHEKALEIGRLAAQWSWEGSASEAAGVAMTKLAAELEQSAETALRVSVGAAKSAEDVRGVKALLNQLLDEAAEFPAVAIDTVDNAVIPPVVTGWEDFELALLQAKISALEFQIVVVLTAGEAADIALTNLLNGGAGNVVNAQKPPSAAPDSTQEDLLDRVKDAWHAMTTFATGVTAFSELNEKLHPKWLKPLERLASLNDLESTLTTIAEVAQGVQEDVKDGKSWVKSVIDRVPEPAAELAGQKFGSTMKLPFADEVMGDVGRNGGKAVKESAQKAYDELHQGKSVIQVAVDVIPEAADKLVAVPQQTGAEYGEKIFEGVKGEADKASAAIGEGRNPILASIFRAGGVRGR